MDELIAAFKEANDGIVNLKELEKELEKAVETSINNASHSSMDLEE